MPTDPRSLELGAHDQASRWTGPLSEGQEGGPVPWERWPYGPPAFHQDACVLFEGSPYCDCRASAADDEDFGYGSGALP